MKTDEASDDLAAAIPDATDEAPFEAQLPDIEVMENGAATTPETGEVPVKAQLPDIEVILKMILSLPHSQRRSL